MPSSIISPFPVFNDLDGSPLENGYIYIGQSNLNPETAPVNVFWDAARTIPAAQPIRTIGGFPSRNGSPSNVYVEADTYSITVRNSRRVFVYSAFDQSDAPSSVFDISTQVITATAGQTTFSLTTFAYLPGTDTLQVYRNGLRLTSVTDYVESNTSTVTMTSPAALGDEFLFQGGAVITGGNIPGTGVSFIQAGTGAIPRNMQDKVRENVSVKDFGAVGDGLTNDTVAFQKALTSINYGSVYATNGEWKIPNFNTSLNSNKGVIISNDGDNGVFYFGRDFSGPKDSSVSESNLSIGSIGYMFDLRNDVADITDAGFSVGLQGRTVFGSSAAKGGRIGVWGAALHNLGATNSSNTNRNYVGVLGVASSENGDGGTGLTVGTSKGAYFGLNAIGRLNAGAQNVFEVTACELDTYTEAGSSAVYVLGATIAGINSVQGTVLDAALEIGGATDAGCTHVGWNYGICFSNIHGLNPFNTNSTIIGGYYGPTAPNGSITVKAGLDLHLFNCTTGLILGPNLVLTDDSLLLAGNQANISTIQAGNNITDANLDLVAKGGGATRIKDGSSVVRIQADIQNGISFYPLSSSIPSTVGQLTVATASNTSLVFKLKGTDNVVRTATITLS